MLARFGSWTVAGTAVTALALTSAASAGCSASAPGDAALRPDAPEQTALAVAAQSGPVTRSQVIANAEQWVAAQLQYCQSPNGKPDPDTSCSSTCMRESSPQWDPYRSDCSGFVSWAWELPPPGLVTSTFAPFDTSESSVIQCADMQPGDAANRDPNTGHIVLFKQWTTKGTEAIFIEEPGCSSSTPYAHEFQSAVTCSGSSASIAYEGDTFTAIRYVNIVDDPADAGAESSSGSGSGSGGGSGGASSSGSSSGSSGGSSSGGPGGSSSGGPGAGSSSGGPGAGGGSGSGSGGSPGTPGGPAPGDSGTGSFDTLSGGNGASCAAASARTPPAGAAAAMLGAGLLALGRRRRRSRAA
jgi:MYXO-CTERM domain-containing protein